MAEKITFCGVHAVDREGLSMNDLISRQGAINAVIKRIEKSECGESVDHNKVLADIKSLPSADVVEVKRGEWKFNNLKGFKVYDCSNCGVHMEAKFNYCPFCGADMRGGRNEQIH